MNAASTHYNHRQRRGHKRWSYRRRILSWTVTGCIVCLTVSRFLLLPSSSVVPTERIPSSATTHKQYVKRNKRGRVVMDTISKVKLSDLKDLNDDSVLLASSSNTTYAQASRAREPIVSLLQEAGIQELDLEILVRLPTWKQVSQLYYDDDTLDGPVVVGMETCDRFRSQVPADEAYIATAGFFNTGTNALTYYLRANLIMPQNKKKSHHQGILTQVPWDKHWFWGMRYNHTAQYHEPWPKDNVLPIVTVRDPLSWMQSLCRQPYLVQWKYTSLHCPNLVPRDEDESVAVRVPAMATDREWPTLIHLWNAWYRDYLESDKPRLIVRHEDLLFRPRQVLEKIQECAGAAWKEPGVFYYVVDRSKWEHVREHGPQSNLISAMIKHGNSQRRKRNMTQADLELADRALDRELMQTFHYQQPLR